MKTRIIASAAFALAIAGIVAWLSPEGPTARASAAAGQVDPPSTTASSPAPPIPQVAQAAGEYAVAARGPNHRRSASLSTAMSPVGQVSTAVPVAISTEHQELINLGSPSGKDTFHEMLEKEPKDTAWAYDMEQRLRLMFESRGAQIYSIECRSTLCEVQSFSHRPEVDPHEMPTPPEPGTIMPSLASGMRVNGRSTDLAYFRRDQINQQMQNEAQLQAARDSRQR